MQPNPLNIFKTIRFRLVSVTLLAVGVPFMIFSWLLNDQLWNFYIKQLESQLEATANIVSETSVPIIQGLRRQQALAELVDRWDRLMGIRIMVADKNGIIIAGTVGFASLKIGTEVEEAISPGMRAALKGKKNSKTWKGPDKDYSETMYVNIPINYQEEVLGAVRVSYSLGQVKSGVASIRRTLGIGFSIYVAVLVLIVFLLATSLARPVEALERGAQKISAGELDHNIQPYGPIEVQQLAVTLNRMTERLASLENLRRRYVSDVSHELRAPLAAIRTMTETLMAHGEDDPELSGRYLPRIVSQTDRLARLASQLLDLAQIESGSFEHASSTVDVREVITDVIQTAEQRAKEQEVQLRTEVSEGLPVVQAQGDRMVQMLLNLVDNAINYTPAGGTVTLRAQARNERLHLQVIDDGPGIPTESLPHLFERFYRVDRARTPNQGGAGLGLSIVQQIVHSHKGEISVESTLGKGTTFHIELPLKA